MGQFVLTASLRIQTNGENKKEFGTISPERYVRPMSGRLGIYTNCLTEHLQTTSSAPSSYISSASTSSTSDTILRKTSEMGKEMY